MPQDNYYTAHREEIRAWQRTYFATPEARALRETRRKRVRDRLLAVVIQAKAHPCVDCGEEFHHCMMDFDHVRGRKDKAVADMVSQAFPLKRLLAEIAKCELVCACCHRLRTWQRRQAVGVRGG